MPELPEVEAYRRLAAEGATGRLIAAVEAPDAWYLKRGTDAPRLRAALVGGVVAAVRRRGKLLLLDICSQGGAVLGLRFGMTGRLLVDGVAAVDSLLYSPARHQPGYERFGVVFDDGGRMVVADPRRLGGVELDPDESRLGPDALSVTTVELAGALRGASVALKARLLDQSKLAGVGNLVADEVLWRAGLAPGCPAGALEPAEVALLQTEIVETLTELIRRGGSHTGDLMPERRPGGRCPRDGSLLARSVVGGRSSWWCPLHQRG